MDFSMRLFFLTVASSAVMALHCSLPGQWERDTHAQMSVLSAESCSRCQPCRSHGIKDDQQTSLVSQRAQQICQFPALLYPATQVCQSPRCSFPCSDGRQWIISKIIHFMFDKVRVFKMYSMYVVWLMP